MPTLPSALTRGAIAGAGTFSGDWFIVEHAGGLFRISRAELWAAMQAAITSAGVPVYVPHLEVTTGDIIIARTGFPYGYVARPDVAGARKLRFSVTGGGALEELGIYASAIYAPFVGTTAAGANTVIDAGGGGSILRSTSSSIYKRDVEDLESERADAVVENARPIWYRSTSPYDRGDWGWYGLIAEELAAIDPRLVSFAYREEDYETVVLEPAVDDKPALTERRPKPGAEKVPDGIAYDRLTVMLLDVVRREKAKTAALETALAALTARVQALEPA